MHELLDFCRFGQGGASPSIDTSMHGLLRVPHVDHLHPDAIIALAAAADGEELTKQCFGEEVAWVPWRRPGFELALRIERLHESRPGLKGVVLGGHGLTTWGRDLAGVRAQLPGPDPPGGGVHPRPGQAGAAGRPPPRVRAPARTGAAATRSGHGARAAGLASTERHVVGHWIDSEPVLDFIAREAAPRVVPLGTSCPDHPSAPRCVRCCWTSPPVRPWRTRSRASASCTGSTGPNTLPTTSGTPTPDCRCGAQTPPSSWSPESACSASAATARPPASPASSTWPRSTRSAEPRPCRRTRRSPRPRSSASSTGSWRSASSSAARGRSHSPARSRS